MEADADVADGRGAPADRYARQVRFAGIGPAGQERLAAAIVSVVGCGALGSASVNLLARGGVGEIRIIDRDVVELTNLQRQLLFEEADAHAGTPKAVAAAAAVGRINASVRAVAHVADVTPANVMALIAGSDVVIDGTDNLETRYLLNDACVKLGIPWVYGGVIGSTGMAMTIIPGLTGCLRCRFPTPPDPGALETCETAGVLASGAVMVAAFQWTEAVKLIVGANRGTAGAMLAVDVWDGDYTLLDPVPPRPGCPCCVERRFAYLDAKATSRATTLCGRDVIQVNPGRTTVLDLAALGARLSPLSTATPVVNEHLVRVRVDGHELTVFADGRAFIKGTADPAVARSLYARWIGV